MRGFSCACSPRPRGTREQRRARQSLPQKQGVSKEDCVVPAKAGTLRLCFCSHPSKAAAKGGRKSRVPRTRAARGIAPIWPRGHGWPLGQTRSPVANPRRKARARRRGRVLLGYFLLHEQEKVTRPPGGRTE